MKLTQDRQRLTVSSLATIYGCCGLFDMCGDDDLMSLSFEGQAPFLDWIGWQATNECDIVREFIAWSRVEDCNDLYLCDPCADPYGIEFGVCDFKLHDFGRLRVQSPVRDITKAFLKLCERQPRYRLDGTPINNDIEFDVRLATEEIIKELKRRVIVGNATTCGDFSGLENLVKTGYTNIDGRHCQLMDSIVINWSSNGMGGGNGITWNGNPVLNTFNFVDVLLAAFRQILQRISWSATLAAQQMQLGDIVLVAPTQLIRCILDAYTCWSVCEGSQYNETSLSTLEARQFRNSLSGGMFKAGRIYLDNFEVPLIAYDWGLVKGPTRFDAYLLTGSVGNVKTIHGQYNDMRNITDYLGAATPMVKAIDGGRLLMWPQSDHTCVGQIVEMQPRLLNWAPWAQVRFQNVSCRQPNPVIVPDPCETSFFPQTSFEPATC